MSSGSAQTQPNMVDCHCSSINIDDDNGQYQSDVTIDFSDSDDYFNIEEEPVNMVGDIS